MDMQGVLGAQERVHVCDEGESEMSKHTPGLWHAENSSVIDSQDQIVVTCIRGSVNRYDHAEDYATASLIAAAPDLLEALQVCLELIEVISPFESDTTRKARAAIAKATGEKE